MMLLAGSVALCAVAGKQHQISLGSMQYCLIDNYGPCTTQQHKEQWFQSVVFLEKPASRGYW